MSEFLSLVRDLCVPRTGIVTDGNEVLFRRLTEELPFRLHRFASGETYNGWAVPDNWKVEQAVIRKDGVVVFDGKSHSLGVACYSKSFNGTLDWDTLQQHITTIPELPDAYRFHCMWQYRPWAADWAFCVPYRIYRTLGPGDYEVDLVTTYEPGEMIVADYDHRGQSDTTIVFHTNSCHPHMANDGFAGSAVKIRLFQWLQGQKTRYTYRLIIGPEHVGTVFYLRDMDDSELKRLAGGVFGGLMGVEGSFQVASTFLGNHPLDKIFHNVVRHYASDPEFVPWRMSLGKDETAWEAPGYEVPFVQANRVRERSAPFPEYHTSLDDPDLVKQPLLEEFLDIFKKVVFVLENNCTVKRKFKGLISLSNPQYDLYIERFDPAMTKDLADASDKWGYLQDCLPRYFDDRMTILDIAEKHDLPFDQLFRYLKKFEDKGLVQLNFAPIDRPPTSST